MIEIKNEILPRVTEQNIHNEEKMWHVKLPSDYYQFLLRTNGGVPKKCEFKLNAHVYAIKSFLCILEDTENSEFGSYDIDVVLSQIEERLTDNEDLVGCELLPIAELFAGDYLCLDFRLNKEKPHICIWDHEESGELEPVTAYVASSFSEFAEILSE